MKKKEKEIVFNSLLILRGSLNGNIVNIPDDEILDLLEKESASTMIMFWNLVDENKKLKEELDNINNYDYE